MLKKSACLALLLLLNCAAINRTQAPEMYTAAMIFAPGVGSGTAFLYRGQIVTAGHVCAAWDELKGAPIQMIYLGEGKRYVQGGQYVPLAYQFDDATDVCVLRALTPAKHLLVDLARAESPSLGDPVTIVGAPMGLYLVRTDGYIANLSEKRVQGLMLVSAPAYGGNSGSPVMDRHGRLLGILTAGFPNYPVLSCVFQVAKVDIWMEALGL